MTKVTIFQTMFLTKKPYYVDSEAIVNRIRTGKSKAIVERLRAERDELKQKDLKEQLPAICFSGTFTSRENKSLMVHSGLVAIDFDHLDGDLPKFRAKIDSDRYTHISFVSPRGNGLKVVV